MARLATSGAPNPERSWELDFHDLGFSSGELRTSVRFAHVLASRQGIEDVEVTILCPECDSKVMLDVTHETAMRTALSLLSRTPDTQRSLELPDAESAGLPPFSKDNSWRARSTAIREEVALLLESLPVAEVMRKKVQSVRASARVSALATAFEPDDLTGLIVTDDEHRPTGLLTPAQLLRVVSGVSRERFEGMHVRHVMLSRLFCVRSDAPLVRVMELCKQKGAHKIAVVGEDGKLVGSICPRDLLNYLAL